MAIQIAKAEMKFEQCRNRFDREVKTMWENHRNLVKNKGISMTLNHIIEQRLTNITNKLRDIYQYRINYFLRNSYHDSNKTYFKYLSTMIIDTKQSFTDQQLQLLNRGPTYVPPCQMYLSLSGHLSMDHILKKQYAPLQHQLVRLFSKYHINIAQSMEIEKKMSEQFKALFSLTIPSSILHRAVYEKKLVQSIYHVLSKHNLILRRTADHMNRFYVGNKDDFERKSNAYLINNDAYRVLMTISEENTEQQIQIEINEMIESMNMALDILKRRKALNQDVIKRITIDKTKVRVPHLYFLPDVSNVRLPSVNLIIIFYLLLSFLFE